MPRSQNTSATAGAFIIAFAVFLIAALLTATPSAAQVDGTSAVFINELHYDNDGSDVGEGVEVAGPAGTDLSGWRLIYYNGNGGASYGTAHTFAGAIPDEGDGAGAVWVDVAGLQNGAPDGLALVDADGGVVQFLSYEGSFSAVDGPAIGLTSTDIGVSQSSSTPVDQSLQLAGTGSTAADFTWSTPAAASRGLINAGQIIGTGGSDAITLSEIRIDQPGADVDELAELAGPAGAAIENLTYLVIGDGTGGSGVLEVVIDLSGNSFNADGFFTIAEAGLTTGAPDLVTDLNFENSDNVTHLIVADFTGANGDDLDTDDDGTLDATPWSEIIDLIALVEQDPAVDTEQHYGPPSVGPDGTFVPGHVYVCDGEWVIGTFGDLSSDTPGAANSCGGGNPGGVTLIHDIQGSVSAPDPDAPTRFPADGDPIDNSPLVGQSVVVEAIVTGWDDEAGQSNSGAIFHTDRGFFIQEEDADADADPTTSEGIFVQFSSSLDDVAAYSPGDLVRVTGTVAEHFEFTVLSAGATVEILSPNNPLPTAAVIEEGINRDGYEALEGMLVTLPVSVANSGGTNRFGELIVTPGPIKDILVRPDTNDGLLALDSDAGAGNPVLPRKPNMASTTLVKADLFATIENATGPLAYSFDLYKILIQPGALPTVTPDSTVTYPSTGLEPAGADQIRITALNVENFFPVGVSHDGSPITEIEYANKRDRIVDAVDSLLSRPDVVGLEEVYNLAVLEDVADQLGGYTAYLVEGNDNRGIDVGFLVKDTMVVTGVTQIAATFPDIAEGCGDTEFLFDRPPLQVDLAIGATTLSVITNHFSSKAAPDVCRDAQASVLRDHVAGLEAAGKDVVVTGDLNAFEDETPLGILTDGTTTLTNLWSTAGTDNAYSFQFSGRLQTLDHMLISDGLNAYAPTLTYAHFNTDYYDRQWDEPSLDGSFSDGHSFSDHDPPVLTLTVGDSSLGGTVLKANGRPAKNIAVELFAIEDGTAAVPVSTTVTNRDGSYSFSVDPGCFIVVLVAPTNKTFIGGTKTMVHYVCVGAGQDISNLDAQLD